MKTHVGKIAGSSFCRVCNEKSEKLPMRSVSAVYLRRRNIRIMSGATM